MTWHIVSHGVPPGDAASIIRLVENTRIDCTLDRDGSHILIDGTDPSAHLCDDQVNENVSLVSSVPRLREILVEKMRGYAIDHDIVMEGRDICSVGFPEKPYTVFIAAFPYCRLRRLPVAGLRDRITPRGRAEVSVRPA